MENIWILKLRANIWNPPRLWLCFGVKRSLLTFEKNPILLNRKLHLLKCSQNNSETASKRSWSAWRGVSQTRVRQSKMPENGISSLLHAIRFYFAGLFSGVSLYVRFFRKDLFVITNDNCRKLIFEPMLWKICLLHIMHVWHALFEEIFCYWFLYLIDKGFPFVFCVTDEFQMYCFKYT